MLLVILALSYVPLLQAKELVSKTTLFDTYSRSEPVLEMRCHKTWSLGSSQGSRICKIEGGLFRGSPSVTEWLGKDFTGGTTGCSPGSAGRIVARS
jgi:hypothetical protein